MEVGNDIFSLDIFTHKADLAVSLVLITTVKVGKRYFEDTAFQTLGSDFYTERGRRIRYKLKCYTKKQLRTQSCSLCHNSFAGISVSEDRRSLDVVKLFLLERVLAAVDKHI